MAKGSPWAFDSTILASPPPSGEDASDRFYLAVIEAIARAAGPDDAPSDVLNGVAEALCFMYLQFLDPSKCKSPEDGKALLLANVDASYDLVARLITESSRIGKVGL